MANVLLIQVHRKRVVFEEVKAFLSLIGEIAINIDAPDKLAILQLPYLAREHRLTSYETAFLELAIRLQSSLATNDQALVRAAADAKVQLLKISG
jgi:predicted nucleic acid-binding protein